jgi:diacylglycerol kinase (ATP)
VTRPCGDAESGVSAVRGPSRRPILLLVNPAAGGKPASGRRLSDDPARLEPEALAAAVRAHGLDVRLRILVVGDDPGQLASSAAERYDVVVAGGDGTVGPAGLALIDTPAALGILALGSFNNVARGLSLPDQLEPAISAIARGRMAYVDVGIAECDGAGPEAFLEAGGVGLDAMGFDAVLRAERLGVWHGIRFLWRAMRRLPAGIELDLDGRALLTSSPTLVICNGPYHGLGFATAPDADPIDGQLDVAIFERMGRMRTIVHYLRVARGRPIRDPRVRIERGTRIRVRASRGTLPVQVDGRPIGVTPTTFTLRPAALRIFR